jgi:hypothetical protein
VPELEDAVLPGFQPRAISPDQTFFCWRRPDRISRSVDRLQGKFGDSLRSFLPRLVRLIWECPRDRMDMVVDGQDRDVGVHNKN